MVIALFSQMSLAPDISKEASVIEAKEDAAKSIVFEMAYA